MSSPPHSPSLPPPPAVEINALVAHAAPARNAGGARVPTPDAGGGGEPTGRAAAAALTAGEHAPAPLLHHHHATGADRAAAKAHTAEVEQSHSAGEAGGRGSSRPAGAEVGIANKQMDSRRTRWGVAQGRKGA